MIHGPPGQSVVIGFNPGSGSGNRSARVEDLANRLVQAGLRVETSDSIDESIAIGIREYNAGSLRAFVVGGGDGTLRVMAEKLPAGVPIAVFPLGTENLLAGYLGLDRRAETVVAAVLGGQERWLDAGSANGRLFLVMASCGFDADVVERMHRGRQGNITRLSWLLPTARSVWNYRFPRLLIQPDRGEEISSHRWAFVFNVPRYAMKLNMAPDADPADGMLDLCTFRRGGLFHGLAYIAAVLLGKHRRWTGGVQRRIQSIAIRSAEPVAFQLDGDPGGYLPVAIEVLPKRVRILVPPDRT